MKSKKAKYKIIKENVCTVDCKCGWNIFIGGADPKDLKELKRFLSGKPLKVKFYTKK